MLEKGYVQLYTGNGKGKTTAALGLALRASGAGLKSIIIQFMKGQHYSELDAISKLKGHITIEQYGSTRFCSLNDDNFEEHYSLARNGMKRAQEVLSKSQFDIIILDEIVTSLYFKIITLDEIIKLIELKPANKELVLTGRNAPQHLISLCDLVTEMTDIKHYYAQGVNAREGIEK
ncbi:MAG: cob(I)yrinic acid a,c-diamide adenosyltransferase [Spirochaetota bacterium]